uniref:UBC core domain-containing protein n=1 Tax=Pundamilia nyererei TaxID=303518 RepID=A0A3B4FD18_9CICH
MRIPGIPPKKNSFCSCPFAVAIRTENRYVYGVTRCVQMRPATTIIIYKIPSKQPTPLRKAITLMTDPSTCSSDSESLASGRSPSRYATLTATFVFASRTILLSVISLLNEPNTFSPANVDASVMYRKWRDSKGKDREYVEIIRKQVLATKAEAERDGVKVPTTLAEYCVRTRAPAPDEGSDLFYDYCYDEDDVEGEDGDCCYDEDDSGNEES